MANNTTPTTRRKAGRKMKGTQPRVPLCFSVDSETKRLVKELRGNGYEVNILVETAIREFHSKVFEHSNVFEL